MNTHDRHEHRDHPDAPGDFDGVDDAPATRAPGIRPLGFWLTVLDRRIAAEVDAALADEGVTRREWRRLNLVAGAVRDERLAARLAARPRKLDDLVERGWVGGERGDWTLTEAGRAALDALTARVQAVRDRVRSAVSDEEYATTLSSLEAIARELGWDESMPEPRRGRGHRRCRGHAHPHGHRNGEGPGHARRQDDVHVHVHLHDRAHARGRRGHGGHDRHGG